MSLPEDVQRRLLKIGIVLAVVIFGVIPYLYGALMRSGANGCKKIHHEPYIAEKCFTAQEWGTVLRLYDSQTGELLAERDYLDPNGYELNWIDRTEYFKVSGPNGEMREVVLQPMVIFDTSAQDGEGYVRLPPTWLDRLRAKLP
jgi:hypothetical protein